MNQKLFQKIKRSIFILIFIFSFNAKSNAQVEVKLNPPLALFGLFQLGIEFPMKTNFGFETEVIFFAIEENFGAGLIAHGKYYFNPDFGSDKFYAGLFAGGFGGERNKIAGFGFETGFKWIGGRNILFEIGGGVGRVYSDGESEVVPYGRLMLGYRFSKKKKN